MCAAKSPAKVCIGLLNPKSPENVDSVLRAAGNYGVNNIFYTGTRYPRAARLNPSTVDIRRKVSKDITLTGVDDLLAALPAEIVPELSPEFAQSADEKLSIICVELAENAIALPQYQHPQNALYIFGPEDGTIGQDIIDRADAVVYVPTVGCMNLAATVAVVLYDRLAKTSTDSSSSSEGNRLIRESRDVNNGLKVG